MPKKAPASVKDDQPVSPIPKRLLPEQLLALNRITSDKLVKAARGQVKAGKTYEVDFGVRVTGQVVIGADTSTMANNVPDSADLVQCLLAQFGPRKRRQIVQELLVAGIPRTIAPDDQPIEGLAELANQLIDGLTTVSSRPRRGNVTGACEVQLVEWS